MRSTEGRYRIRRYCGVRYVAAWNEAPGHWARCMICGRAWDDDKSTDLTPVPSGRCPFEDFRGHDCDAGRALEAGR